MFFPQFPVSPPPSTPPAEERQFSVTNDGGYRADLIRLEAARPDASDDPRRGARREPPVLQELPLTWTLQELWKLQAESDEWDEVFHRPTLEATQRAATLLGQLQTVLPETRLPKAIPVPIGDGGIYFEWVLDEKGVRLVIPPDPSLAYIHSDGPTITASAEPATVHGLHDRLGWLQQ